MTTQRLTDEQLTILSNAYFEDPDFRNHIVRLIAKYADKKRNDVVRHFDPAKKRGRPAGSAQAAKAAAPKKRGHPAKVSNGKRGQQSHIAAIMAVLTKHPKGMKVGALAMALEKAEHPMKASMINTYLFNAAKKGEVKKEGNRGSIIYRLSKKPESTKAAAE